MASDSQRDHELLQRLAAVLDPGDRQPAADRVAAIWTYAQAAPAPAVGRLPVRWRSRWLLAAAAAVCVALVVGFAAANLVVERGVLEFAGTLMSADDPSVQAMATVRMTGIGRVITIESDDLRILPTGEYYEVWFVGPGDTPASPNRVSAGTFHPDQDGHSAVRLTAAVDPALLPLLSVTAEPADGNPERTGPEVLRADLAD
ncbi:MAG: anti-sigma factor domain-containing protein [Egibacteraceae bacterium]